MRHLDLFSGIGGFALGLESTGLYETAAFCEIEPFPRRVLTKHWPAVPIYEDVRDVGADRLAGDGIGGIDILTGGFPCQDISLAGRREGIDGPRSRLWFELYRILIEVRPRWAIIENVSGLRTIAGDIILAQLDRAGYARWPMVVGAVHAGAPHRRQRVWIVAHDMCGGLQRSKEGRKGRVVGILSGDEGISGQDAPHAQRHDLRQQQGRAESGWTGAAELGDDGEIGQLVSGRNQWHWHRAPEPVLRGVDDGLPCSLHRRERLKALGNAVVPQIVVAIGRAIADISATNP